MIIIELSYVHTSSSQDHHSNGNYYEDCNCCCYRYNQYNIPFFFIAFARACLTKTNISIQTACKKVLVNIDLLIQKQNCYCTADGK